jgi:opacity protein-like surface antigen
VVALALAVIVNPLTTFAGMDETMKAFQQSEFSFARSVSEVPFYPIGWAQDNFYPRAEFKDERGVLPMGAVVENTFNVGLVFPAYVAKRDMLLLGTDIAWDSLDVRSGPYQDQSILRLTPVVGWLHQFGEQETVGVFVAPIFSKELRNDQPWGTSGYGGIIGMHHFNDEWQLLYGGVYEYSFGLSTFYPYLGALWSPTPKCSLALVFPWPTFSYVPSDRWLLQVGLAPGGSSWVVRGNGYETTQSLGSWNLTAGAGYRLHGKIWLFAGAGLAGLRGLKIESGDNQAQLESKPAAVFTLALQIRP